MGFRSVIITECSDENWPAWFRLKYEKILTFPTGDYGAISANQEGKAYGMFQSLPTDIQKAIDWEKTQEFILVYLHECGGITRCQIERKAIHWTEPETWKKTGGVRHSYCYGCSDARDAI